jgi:hypothetical protein
MVFPAQRLPAPIAEEESATATPAKPKPKPPKDKDGTLVDDSSRKSRGFDGTWAAIWSGTVKTVLCSRKIGMVISGRNNAECAEEFTSTLPPEQKVWGGIPEPYNATRTLYRKWKCKSADLSLDGSNLRVRWPEGQLIDWNPKAIPYNVMQTISKYEPHISVYTLKGDQLTRDFDSNGGMIYNRVK